MSFSDDPYRLNLPAVIKVSGGRTSGYLLWQILQRHGGKLPEGAVAVFNNTGLEREETLEFVEQISHEWQVPIVWLEWRLNTTAPLVRAVRNHDGPWDGYEVVTFATASRKGEPYEALIDKKGFLPNRATQFCTKYLKAVITDLYLRCTLGWDAWTLYGGIRYDEPNRFGWVNQDVERETKAAPLIQARVTKPDVRAFWDRQPFDLRIPDYLGNCVGCFNKSLVKLRRIAHEHPQDLEWWIRQEERMKSVAKTRDGALFSIGKPPYAKLRSQPYLPGIFDDEPDDTIPCDCAI